MTIKLRKTLQAVWYAAGPAQYLLYGIWTVVISGLFSFEGAYQLLPTFWKFNGALIVAVTIWGSMAAKQNVILINTFIAIIVGAVYSSKAAMVSFGLDVDILRGATQSHYMSLVLLVAWGFYLANLVARQRMEFTRAGLSDE